MSAQLAILVPVLGRPHRVFPLLQSLEESMRVPYRILFITDPKDKEEKVAIDAFSCEWIDVQSNYAGKINAGFNHTTEPLLFLAADDLHFHEGWFEAASKKLRHPIGVVGTNDMTNPRTYEGDHSTHSLVSREYVEHYGTIDEPGKVLHEGYPHEWVDDELVETAKFRKMYAHARDSRVEHLHPMGGKAPMDFLYEKQKIRMADGRRIYRRRRRLWTSR